MRVRANDRSQHCGRGISIDSPIPWILVAVARERLFFRPKILRTLAPNVRLADLDGRVFVLAETGMGPERVRATLDRIGGRCCRAVFAGFAGGLRPDLAVGDLVWADEVVADDGRRFRPSASAPASVPPGVLRTSSRLVSTLAEKRHLAEIGGDAVDMESAAFAGWCDQHAVRWSCVRAISDDANTALPAELFAVVENGLSLGRLARAVLRRPALLGDLWSLSRSTRKAAKALAGALETWLQQSEEIAT